jgi:hypothetical protein
MVCGSVRTLGSDYIGLVVLYSMGMVEGVIYPHIRQIWDHSLPLLVEEIVRCGFLTSEMTKDLISLFLIYSCTTGHSERSNDIII